MEKHILRNKENGVNNQTSKIAELPHKAYACLYRIAVSKLTTYKESFLKTVAVPKVQVEGMCKHDFTWLNLSL